MSRCVDERDFFCKAMGAPSSSLPKEIVFAFSISSSGKCAGKNMATAEALTLALNIKMKNRPDSPRVQRKSWPSAPRSILKRTRPPAPPPSTTTQSVIKPLTLESTEVLIEPNSITDSSINSSKRSVNSSTEQSSLVLNRIVNNSGRTPTTEESESSSGIAGSVLTNNSNVDPPKKADDIIQLAEKIEKHQIIQDEANSANSDAATVVSARTARKRRIAGIFQHYYPEGGWGYVVLICAFFSQFISSGLQLGFLVLMPYAAKRYHASTTQSDWLTPFSMAVSNFLCPLIVGICRRKSTRLTAVTGGLVTALGCLFTSFATQFHQLFFSYGFMMGLGVAMTKNPATLMVGQYFKRKRDLVEIALVSSHGLGLAAMSAFILISVGSIGWRLGLQALTGVITTLFVLGTFYRSASLYHPQRRAILHLKSQKRKIKSKDKEKNKSTVNEDTTPPFFDFTTLKSRTVQILLVSTMVAGLGLYAPLLYMAQQAFQDGIRGRILLWLLMYFGFAWTLGCLFFGCVAANSSIDCRISKQYLCQTALFLCGVSIMAFMAVDGYKGYVIFVWSYGIFLGGYQYTLKMYIFEKVRARNFARAWGFVQASSSLTLLISIPILSFFSSNGSRREGHGFSATIVILASFIMAMIDVHKKNMKKKRQTCRQIRQQQQLGPKLSALTPDLDPSSSSLNDQANNNPNSSSLANDVLERQNSFTDQDDILPPVSLLSHQRSFIYDDLIDFNNPELSIYSEEGIADMDLPENIYYDDLDYLDNITSCNKVENCLMLSEYEQNLIKETEGGPASHSSSTMRRMGRKWSLLRQPTLQTIHSESEDVSTTVRGHIEEQINITAPSKALFHLSGRTISAVIEENSLNESKDKMA